MRLFNSTVTFILVAAWLLLAFVIMSGARAADAQPADMPGGLDPIVHLDINGIGYCTGFAANANDFNGDEGWAVVTASHCAVHGPVSILGAPGHDKLALELVFLDTVHDVAVFQPRGATGLNVKPLTLACHEAVHVGDAATITGYPKDFGRTTAWGRVSALPSPWKWWPSVYRVDMYAAPGNSGSPVMLDNGHVFGILVGGDPNWVGMSMVVPIAQVCAASISISNAPSV